ncbi:hypothetical protein AB0L00_31595 [Actinoallomurus sp. NPDC052308]|uniref:hypothetical protein n=1 Tax=Actinoallomurus sp. NPDC052308 TaxID=3155530 RepID=UPI0034159832
MTDSEERGVAMVMAYRVERAGAYKIRVDANGKITTFDGTNDKYGIDISFGTADHSTYYAGEHTSDQGLRVVTFEMEEGFWNAIKYLKKFGKDSEKNAGKVWLEQRKIKKEPSGSDGANLSSFVKKTALHFDREWLPHLLKSVSGKASIEYVNEETEVYPAKLDGVFYGFMSMSDIQDGGYEVDEDGWDKTDEDIGK